MKQKTIRDSFTTYDGCVEKNDLNGYGLMHGGRLLTLCDEIGYLAAKKHAECDCLTRAAHNIQFLSMLREGETFSIEAKTVLTGKTTLWVACTVKSGRQTAMSSVFVYIAVDREFKSLSVPEIKAEGAIEKREQAAMQQLMKRVTA